MIILVHAEVFSLHLVLLLTLAYKFLGFHGGCCSNDGLLHCKVFDVVEELDAPIFGVTEFGLVRC
jgi:hypothetical protein